MNYFQNRGPAEILRLRVNLAAGDYRFRYEERSIKAKGREVMSRISNDGQRGLDVYDRFGDTIETREDYPDKPGNRTYYIKNGDASDRKNEPLPPRRRLPGNVICIRPE